MSQRKASESWGISDVRQRDCDGAALYERVSEGFDGRGAERVAQKDDGGGDTSKHPRRGA